MTLTLLHAPKSRSQSFIWLLEEIGQPYEIKQVDIRRGDGSGKLDPTNPHPHGKVPVIIHDDTVVHEQTAIMLYLTDAFPQAKLGPQVGDKLRGNYLSWLSYYSGVVEPAFLCAFMKYDVPRGTAGWVAVPEVMQHINKTLETNEYILGNEFTAVDILYGGTFGFFGDSGLFEKTDALNAYVKRCMSRPALQRAGQKDA
ncbi:glutathione S-transferase [Variibacter gotjawalensis]|uniref:Glutathione S-transferase n=1 Tax=Variibacter gotjawalensis TaxID=1333996 RepID=A0A0S3PQP6_9BRAD|nr:glutathione S-transferase family protein [Variibacter gotjawalensis]NIK48551.1 glutathione S-transferase [Variibacter gotjawalensis]RZS50416.1 glutathione S-transferase [Variibacter gotjawalensis]BAT58250.1 glutathione S-transferase [Variibacter gotjawalensis]